jgi:hypothetical protein
VHVGAPGGWPEGVADYTIMRRGPRAFMDHTPACLPRFPRPCSSYLSTFVLLRSTFVRPFLPHAILAHHGQSVNSAAPKPPIRGVAGPLGWFERSHSSYHRRVNSL